MSLDPCCAREGLRLTDTLPCLCCCCSVTLSLRSLGFCSLILYLLFYQLQKVFDSSHSGKAPLYYLHHPPPTPLPLYFCSPFNPLKSSFSSVLRLLQSPATSVSQSVILRHLILFLGNIGHFLSFQTLFFGFRTPFCPGESPTAPATPQTL